MRCLVEDGGREIATAYTELTDPTELHRRLAPDGDRILSSEAATIDEDWLTVQFQLGDLEDWSLLTTGYEDINLDVRTDHGRFVIKVFAAGRSSDIADRTANLIIRAQAAGVRHPRLHRGPAGRLTHAWHGCAVLVMDFDPGRSLYDLGRAPTAAELAAILSQVARIHTVDLDPPFVADPWAITNLVPMARQVGDLPDPALGRLIGRAIEESGRIDRRALPVTLIHADLTKGNVLLGDDGAVTVLDFAVANSLPRVQELAVVAANLTHEADEPLPARIETIADLYSDLVPNPLTTAERAALRAFGLAAAAMELLGALRERQHGDTGAETDYLIRLGTAGLRDYLTAG